MCWSPSRLLNETMARQNSSSGSIWTGTRRLLRPQPFGILRQADKLELYRRPKGEVVGHIFRTDWEDGYALYTPFDRVALKRHPDWSQKYPGQAWNPSKDLAWVLRQLHRLLNDDLYLGV